LGLSALRVLPGAEGGGLDDSHAAEEHGERAGGSGGIDRACRVQGLGLRV